ncbi:MULTISPECIES: helix-turn-helix transcriptional regulator [unclassified Bradyrhizobium]|uniref:helix-turn-helix transcriptional regulator n=1 Tax=unclassified Bradyrhizobium TaxID=2631580 RepID=UPI001BAA250C|nr:MULTISPECIES: helix-turn-helix transcriptional regulator [unclassified Bradyrhizobium]MBR1225713.1 helix-turn-helix transcriptional regulator [Bradyrhizobium sp. AUGA SZCCT0176]MBR1298224.1 helix-turn-helix transcriptional regulator [Bradyrhizobium sp. AUGA SZCCT0042]
MALSLSSKDVTLLKRVSEALLQPLAPDWLLTAPGVALDLQHLLSMDFIGTTLWNPASGRYENAMCVGRGMDMARAYVAEFQGCDPISPRLRHRKGPTPIYSVIRRDELERTRYFHEFLRTYRTIDGIDLHLYDGGTNVGDFRFWRDRGRTPVGSREMLLLGLLQPVLLRATREVRNQSLAPASLCFQQLTVRERQIAAGVVNGLTDRAIARSLQISYWTVRSHLDHIFEKLAVGNRAALVARLHRGPSATE